MPNPFNMRSVPEAPVPMVPNGLNLDPTDPHQMAGMMLAYLQDMYHGMAMQAKSINRLRASLESIDTDDLDIEHSPTGLGSYWSIPDTFQEAILQTISDTLDWTKISFGATTSGTTLTIASGEVFMRLAHASVNQTNVTISSGSEQWAYLQIESDDTTLSTATIPTSPLSSLPVPTSTYWRVPICSAQLVGGVAVIVKRHTFGDIYVPGIYSA